MESWERREPPTGRASFPIGFSLGAKTGQCAAVRMPLKRPRMIMVGVAFRGPHHGRKTPIDVDDVMQPVHLLEPLQNYVTTIRC